MAVSSTKKLTTALLESEEADMCEIQQFLQQNELILTETAEDIWNSVTGVSNQGRRRGRASRGKMMRRQNLNKGMVIGVGESGMVIPGLNTPIVTGKSLAKLYQPPEKNLSFREKLIEARSQGQKSFRALKRTPLQRGWAGRTLGGTSVGPPDPIEDYKFEGFDCKILVHKRIATVTRSQGVKQRFSCLMVTGNKNGLIGFSEGKARDIKSAIRVAKNKAAQHMMYVERYQDHTIYHNFYEKHHKTSVMALQRPKGHGLVCHRAIKTIAELAGIKDLYCKVEGRTKNYLSVTKAFFMGLNNQQTHQELANKTGYNVVEYRKERRNYPVVVASPTEKNNSDFTRDENFDYRTYFYGGKLPLKKKKREPSHYNLDSYKHFLFEKMKRRNQRNSQMERQMYGLENQKPQKKQEE